MLKWSWGRRGLGYLVAAGSVGATLLLTFAFNLDPVSSMILFILSVLIASWKGGLGPGLAATGISIPLIVKYVLNGGQRFALDPPVMGQLLLFGLVAVLIALLGDRRNQAEESSEKLFKQSAQMERSLKQSGSDKEVLLREIHHRVKNNLQVISSLMNLRSRNVPDLGSRTIFENNIAEIKAIGLVYDKIYRNPDLTHLDFGNYVSSLVDDLCSTYGQLSEGVKINISIPESYFHPDAAVPIGLILNEIVLNSLKHAFPAERGEIFIRVQRNKSSYLIMGDTGVGLPADLEFETADCFGLRMIKMLSSQVGAPIRVERPGTIYTMDLPASLFQPV